MSPPGRGALAGAVTGVLIVVVSALLGWTPDVGGPETSAAPPSPQAAEAFVAAWDRSLTGSWVVEGGFERTSLQGRGTLRTPVRTAQRPPERLVVGFGSAESRLDGRLLSCTTAPDGSLRCQEGGPAPPYAEERADQVDLIRRYVLGPGPLYLVRDAGGGCFELSLHVPIPAPPYGEQAVFCFDGATGAPVRVEIRRPEAVDVMVATAVRSEVADEDLQPVPPVG